MATAWSARNDRRPVTGDLRKRPPDSPEIPDRKFLPFQAWNAPGGRFRRKLGLSCRVGHRLSAVSSASETKRAQS